MNIKKAISVLMISVMVLFCLSACGSQSEPSAEAAPEESDALMCLDRHRGQIAFYHRNNILNIREFLLSGNHKLVAIDATVRTSQHRQKHGYDTIVC